MARETKASRKISAAENIEVVKEFKNFITVAKYDKQGNFLFNTSIEQPLPTEKENREKIFRQCGEGKPVFEKQKAGGNGGSQRKFSEEQILKIKAMVNKGMTDKAISRTVDVASSTIRNIRVGISYADVKL